MAFTTVTITETFEPDQPGGATPEGSVTFTLSQRIHDASGHEVDPEPITVALVAGAISVELYANDDSTTAPVGSYYRVDFDLIGASRQPSKTIAVPHTPTTTTLAALS